MYKLFTTHDNKEIIIKLGDNEAFIPFNQQNLDYAEYLLWLSEGNVPLPADEQGAQ